MDGPRVGHADPVRRAGNELRFMVPGMSCEHCADAITAQLREVAGIASVEIDVVSRWVVIRGRGFHLGAIRTAVDRTGHVAQL